MNEIVSRSAPVPRFNALLASQFAALALLLAAIGVGDPITFATVGAVLSVVALVARAIPAWRVTRVDPNTVLRME